MSISLQLLCLILASVLLSSCAAQPTAGPPTAAPPATLAPSPEPSATASATFTPPSGATLVAGQWNQLFFHPELKKVVLVNGGPDQGKPADNPLELWAWDGTSWTVLSADPEGPVWRNFASVAFDSGRNRLIVYGGLQDQDSRMEDTWEWDGSVWTRFDVPGPGFREGAAMAYDEARGETILFGGANEDFAILGDTWSWDGANWTEVSTEGPSPRFPSGIVYDAARERVLMYGGHFVGPSASIDFDDFWEWDGTAWQQILVQGEAPGVRNIAQMAFDPLQGEVLLFSGGQQQFLGDLWSWDGESWSNVSPGGAPARSGPGGAFDPERNRLVVFGGVGEPGGTAITDTWEWDGQTWTCVHGCR
jgi:hypothetical protein